MKAPRGVAIKADNSSISGTILIRPRDNAVWGFVDANNRACELPVGTVLAPFADGALFQVFPTYDEAVSKAKENIDGYRYIDRQIGKPMMVMNAV